MMSFLPFAILFWDLSSYGLNFQDIPNGARTNVMLYLPTWERMNTFRVLDYRCNECFKQIYDSVIDALIQLNDFINKVNDNENNTEMDDESNQEIKIMHRKHRLNELYLLKLPALTSRCYHKYQSMRGQNLTLQLFRLLKIQPRKVQETLMLDGINSSIILEKLFIVSSRIIMYDMVFNSCNNATSSIHDDIHRMMYQFCYKQLFPSMHVIYYLEENSDLISDAQQKSVDHLHDMLDNEDLMLWHHTFIEKQWKPKDLWRTVHIYLDEYFPLREVDVFYRDIWSNLDVHFLLKLFELKSYNIKWEEQSQDQMLMKLVIMIHDSIWMLVEHNNDELLRLLIYRLHQNNALGLLRYNHFLTHFIKEYHGDLDFLSTLFYVFVNDEKRARIIAEDLCFTFIDQNGTATPSIIRLAEQENFDEQTLNQLVKIYTTYSMFEEKLQELYLEQILGTLCGIRQDWNFSNLVNMVRSGEITNEMVTAATVSWMKNNGWQMLFSF